MAEKESCSLVLVVPKPLVKTVKTALETHNLLDKSYKISQYSSKQDSQVTGNITEKLEVEGCCIPTKVSPPMDHEGLLHEATTRDGFLLSLLRRIEMEQYSSEIGLLVKVNELAHTSSSDFKQKASPKCLLSQTIDLWLQKVRNPRIPGDCQPDYLKNGHSPKGSSTQSSNYVIYPPLMLLQQSFLALKISTDVEGKYHAYLPELYAMICKVFKVSHIATTGRIPCSKDPDTAYTFSGKEQEEVEDRANTLRSPLQFMPLHGDFGPYLPLPQRPKTSDFEAAFWCSTVQNSIFQTWAPRYCMFSRGNTSEKARIQIFPSLKEEALGCKAEQTTAVDLYAGIGYFAFSYARAGVGKVICWEINPWSIEGLRRGAQGNDWNFDLFDEDQDNRTALRGVARRSGKFLAFERSNSYASFQVNCIRDLIPPVRHVNCGYLPSSSDSWRSAVQVLDQSLGGWIHTHENIARKDIEVRKHEIVALFSGLVSNIHPPDGHQRFAVSCEHLERVKSYSPGVYHCVLDIAIRPADP